MGVESHVAFYATVRQMNDEQLFSLFRTINSAQILAIVSIATGTLALREYVVYLGAEWRTWKLLFKRRIMPARVAIIATRYAYIGAFVSAVIFQLGKPKADSCLIIYRAVYGLYVVLWSSAGSIFLMRLSIIYAREPRVMVFFVALWLTCMSLWIYVVTLFKASPVPMALQYPYGPTCQTGSVPRNSAIAWAGSIVFDSAVFVATIVRFRNMSKAREPSVQMRSRKWLFESSMYYFGASLIFNAALMLSSVLVKDAVLSNLGTGCAFAVHAIMASRMVYEAKGWSRDDTEDRDGMMLNTYNERKKNGGGGAGGDAGITSRIAYSVEQTVVRSESGCNQGDIDDGHGDESYDMEARREQRRKRHFQSASDDKDGEQFTRDGHDIAEQQGERDQKFDVEQSSRRSVSSMQSRIKGVSGRYFGPSATRSSSMRRTSIIRGDAESVDRQHAATTIAARRGRDTAALTTTRDATVAIPPAAAYIGGDALHREPSKKTSNMTLTDAWDGVFGKNTKIGDASSNNALQTNPFEAMTATGTENIAPLNFTPRADQPMPPPPRPSGHQAQQLPATPHSTGPPSYSTEST